jgi:hypothetical protein
LVFNNSNDFLSAQQYVYCIILLYVNIIIVKINDLLRHTATSIGHLQVTVKRNEVFGCLFSLRVSSVGDVVCVLDCVACSGSIFLGLCFVLALCDYFIKYRIFLSLCICRLSLLFFTAFVYVDFSVVFICFILFLML